MMLVKLGGSVITDKTQYRTFREDVLSRLVGEIVSAGKEVVLIHGAGSFGHVLASEHHIQNGYTDESQIPAAAKVMEDVRDLNLRVMRVLNDGGLPSASLPPSAVATLRSGELDELNVDLFRRYLEVGICPVTFGDVALDSERRFGICSGDHLMERLARELRPERVIFVSDIDGVFTADPSSDPDAMLIEVVDRTILDSLPRTQRCADVTGSIFGKIEKMLRIASWGGDAIVLNGNVPGRLGAALRGEAVRGSRVRGDAI
ncbi:MAG TPA: isopentenyl phosphate kinase [Methanomassiliicoccaceae archaeon]|jgi:isopentenyl phosphate kinase|nr:isopentenyl phosphate kinase family protein [Euryarchaeota archaeon]HOB39194.1 isopentenyl phosphate kinase [Methanomassiliicoccaceae archaeon]HOK27953.1 isopentenyl phosphate kinase [Methanomassiliicoccaceae archaeon]HOL07341.1 isopentenyl phosphate kinase [Methanomassiliicoccaceae archaeon]HOQ25692.1 isopentenyl phosphate kinase [Methanomassiliicoccaceae archaeon]